MIFSVYAERREKVTALDRKVQLPVFLFFCAAEMLPNRKRGDRRRDAHKCFPAETAPETEPQWVSFQGLLAVAYYWFC